MWKTHNEKSLRKGVYKYIPHSGRSSEFVFSTAKKKKTERDQEKLIEKKFVTRRLLFVHTKAYNSVITQLREIRFPRFWPTLRFKPLYVVATFKFSGYRLYAQKIDYVTMGPNILLTYCEEMERNQK